MTEQKFEQKDRTQVRTKLEFRKKLEQNKNRIRTAIEQRFEQKVRTDLEQSEAELITQS